MLKVEVVEKDGKDRLVVNSIVDEESYCSNKFKQIKEKIESCLLTDKQVIDELIKYKFYEVGQYIENFSFYSKYNHSKNHIEEFIPEVFCDCINSIIEIQVDVKIGPLYNWNKPYSASDFLDTLKKTIDIYRLDNNKISSSENDNLEEHFNVFIYFNTANSSQIIKDEIANSINIASEILQKTLQTLLQNLDKDLITSYFTFPEEIKAACKQYLVYFAQFLMDLGIEADTEIKEEAQRTLFKVIPKNKEESLDKIREALDVYLNIPKDFDIQVAQNNDVAVMQWQANVKHLEGQIMLAKAAMQMKDATINSQIATIESLKLSNYQYREILEQKNLESEAKNEEEIAGGLVKVKEYDGDGFSINLPELLRRLKRIFK